MTTAPEGADRPADTSPRRSSPPVATRKTRAHRRTWRPGTAGSMVILIRRAQTGDRLAGTGLRDPVRGRPCRLERPMTGPAVVSVARINPELARRSWGRVQRLVAGDGPGNASENLRCFIAVFGHGDGVRETIERVRRVLAAGTPDRLRPHIAVQPALSSEPSADTPSTLYVNWLFEPGTPDTLVEDINMHTLTLAIFAAIQGTPKARVTWPRDDEIAARVMTAAVPAQGRVQ